MADQNQQMVQQYNIQGMLAAMRNMQAAMRKQDTALKGVAQELARIKGALKAAEERFTAMTLAERLRSQAEREIPFYYNIEITLAASSTARTPGTALIEQEGAFLLQRIFASYRPTDGSNSGYWLPISSDNPGAAGGVTDSIDFVWDWTEGTARRGRNDNNIPGGILYRTDQDGVLPCSDVFIAASTVEFGVTLLRAPTYAGVLVVTLCGTQLLSAGA